MATKKAVATRTETKMVAGKMMTVTTIEEVITRPDGSTEKKTSVKAHDGLPNDSDGAAALLASLSKEAPLKAKPPPRTEDFRRLALEGGRRSQKHNAVRAAHGAPPLQLCPKLCAFAQDWADQIAKRGKMEHRPKNAYGENLFFAMSSGGPDPLQSVDAWYDEIADYDFAKPAFDKKTGHFSQVVWVASKSVGVAFAQPRPDTVYVVANYDPPGNVIGRFPENVHKAV